MKTQPIDFDLATKPAMKSRFKRLLERQFSSVLRIAPEPEISSGEFEPSSACLVNMVRNFIEEGSEKRFSLLMSEDSVFSGENNKAQNLFEASEILKGLVLCASVTEKTLLAETARIVEKNSKICKRKDGTFRKIVSNGLSNLGYDSSVCKSRWEKSPSFPAGEYEYIDVMIDGERFLIDVDFRSEFEIARPTKAYKTTIQALPHIYVGKSDRLQKIVTLVSDAAKQSLRKKEMPVPPWRRKDYMASKWLAPHARVTDPPSGAELANGRSDDWVSPPSQLPGVGARKKNITAGLASVMMGD